MQDRVKPTGGGGGEKPPGKPVTPPPPPGQAPAAKPPMPTPPPPLPAPVRQTQRKPVPPPPPLSPSPPLGGRTRGARRFRMPPGLRWALWLLVGIAVTGGAGYLVAALWLFPAPLLPNERQVARVGGLRENEARHALERLGLTAEIAGHEPSPNIAQGAVIWQDPPPGVTVPRGTAVRLILSTGLPVVAVPDVRGFDPDFARRLLAAAGLRVDGVDTVEVKGVPAGAAGATDPVAGDSVLIGRSIILHLAR